MAQPRTESLHPDAAGIDTLPGAEVLGRLLSGQMAALEAVASALPAIEAGASLMADCLGSGGCLAYAGAGSSALMAVADALELPGTFGIDPGRIRLLMAGGLPRDARMPGDTEDDAEAGTAAAAALGPGDVVIAVTASGSTPYPMAVARAARSRGARVIALANNRGAAILGQADVAICLPTPPEIIAGSTRMGAGTAQKAALNLLSTLAAIRLGQVHDGMMIGLVADNAKLRARAAAIVQAIADCDRLTAEAALAASGGLVKPAVLMARGMSLQQARDALQQGQGNLRAALARTEDPGASSRAPTNQGSRT